LTSFTNSQSSRASSRVNSAVLGPAEHSSLPLLSARFRFAIRKHHCRKKAAKMTAAVRTPDGCDWFFARDVAVTY
jgi:hypothetical protein